MALEDFSSSEKIFPFGASDYTAGRSGSGLLRTNNNGKWAIERNFLHNELVAGNMHLSDDELQAMFLDYVEKQEFNEFYNIKNGKFHYAPVAKRGNQAYAIKKGQQRDRIVDAMSKIQFDEPVPGFRNLRRTKLLFVTLTFDPRKFTPEEAWSALKSTRPEGSDSLYNVINSFGSNMRHILGSFGKLTSKEAQSNGYPAPHLLFVLDNYVTVRRKKIKGDLVRWFIDDPEILKKLGKSPEDRKLLKRDYQRGIDSNPVWKHGFFDIEGVVSEGKFKGRKNVCAYIFKYASKCLTKDSSYAIKGLRTIKDSKDHKQLVALYTLFCNKCFCNRDITYGSGFRERICMLTRKKAVEEGEPSPWILLGTVDEETYQRMMELKKDPLRNHRFRECEIS